MMVNENHVEPIALSALQHWQYCPRQCGLIHLEQVFDENIHTLRGQAVHARVDKPSVLSEKGMRVERALPLWHDALGLVGKADVVEFSPSGAPYPVEYKHGNRNKAADIALCDDLQLAGQAMCLEFMLNLEITEGAIYYATSKRRRVVPITIALRNQVQAVSASVRAMLQTAQLPAPLPPEQAVKRCKACSLIDRCQPTVFAATAQAARHALFDPEA
jgi:CRISPR-associated exonuclease Cas4